MVLPRRVPRETSQRRPNVVAQRPDRTFSAMDQIPHPQKRPTRVSVFFGFISFKGSHLGARATTGKLTVTYCVLNLHTLLLRLINAICPIIPTASSCSKKFYNYYLIYCQNHGNSINLHMYVYS